jgi:hypothetical protein
MPARSLGLPLAVGVLAHVACTSTTTPPKQDAPATEVAQTEIDAAGKPVPPAAWEIHEWGVLSVSSDRLSVGRVVAGPAGTAPRIPAPMGRKKKPVLYVHLGKGVDSQTFSVDVAPANGRVVEHWPRTIPAAVSPTIGWRDVKASVDACAGQHFAYPQRGEPGCAAPDGICEVAELATVETPDGVCLEVGGKTFEHLFYRADLDTMALGIAIDAIDVGPLRLTNHGAAPLAAAMRVTTTGTRESTRVDLLSSIAPGGQATLVRGGATGSDVATAIELMRAELVTRGLTTHEADAFVRAWETDLFGAFGAAPPGTVETDVVLVWLDPATVDTLVPLMISPRPTAILRVHLLVIELSA